MQPGRPRISVLMPVFNAARFLHESVNSILNQTFADFELIAADDGSTDGSTGILMSFRDPRIRVLALPHRGIPDTINTALAAARGLYAARMDADDRAMPERLQTQMDLIENGKADVISARVRIFRDDGPVMDGFRQYAEWINGLTDHRNISNEIFVEDPLPSPTLFMRTKSLIAVGGWDPGVYPDDYNLTLKNFMAGYRFEKTAETLLEWRDHEGRFSRTSPLVADQSFFELKAKAFAAPGIRPDAGIVIWGIGGNAKRLFKALVAAGVCPAGFTAQSRFLREPSLYGLPVKPPEKWDHAFFLLASAAKGARHEAETTLAAMGKAVWRDYLPFCRSSKPLETGPGR